MLLYRFLSVIQRGGEGEQQDMLGGVYKLQKDDSSWGNYTGETPLQLGEQHRLNTAATGTTQLAYKQQQQQSPSSRQLLFQRRQGAHGIGTTAHLQQRRLYYKRHLHAGLHQQVGRATKQCAWRPR